MFFSHLLNLDICLLSGHVCKSDDVLNHIYADILGEKKNHKLSSNTITYKHIGIHTTILPVVYCLPFHSLQLAYACKAWPCINQRPRQMGATLFWRDFEWTKNTQFNLLNRDPEHCARPDRDRLMLVDYMHHESRRKSHSKQYTTSWMERSSLLVWIEMLTQRPRVRK